jgi:hypothetical protein
LCSGFPFSLEELLAFSRGFELFGDICIRSEPADDIAFGVLDRQRAGQKPAILAGLAAERECVLPRLACLEGVSDALDDPVHVIGVVHFLPAPALHLLERGAGVLVPALVVPEDPTAGVGHPGELGNAVCQRAKATLAFDDRFLCALPFDHFAEVRCHAWQFAAVRPLATLRFAGSPST